MMKLDALSYFEISLLSKSIQNDWFDFFYGCGVPRDQIVVFENEQNISVVIYTRSFALKRKIKTKFKKKFPSKVRLKIRILAKHDWFDKWQKDYGIMPLGSRFILVPAWKRRGFRPGKRLPLYLDPQGVSGSGQHPTTQIMIEFLERLDGKFKNCLDLGTGTGILSIAASKLGAQEIVAIDNDGRAVRAARHNFKLNQVPNADACFEDVTKSKNKQKFDLVVANLISPVLERIQDSLFGAVKKGGYLAVSGIHVQNFADFKTNFRHASFRCLRIMKKRGWIGMLFKRK